MASINRHPSNSNQRPPDRRIARTRKMLGDALIALILERGYDSVTIQDIADRANLSRATFYLHFTDKDQLLMESLREVFDGLAEGIRPTSSPRLNEYMKENPPSLVAFRHAAANRDLYRVMLQARSSGAFAEQVRQYIAALILEHLKTAAAQQALPLQPEIISQHMASSLVGLLIWWLETEPGYSPEEMAEIYRTLNLSALEALQKVTESN